MLQRHLATWFELKLQTTSCTQCGPMLPFLSACASALVGQRNYKMAAMELVIKVNEKLKSLTNYAYASSKIVHFNCSTRVLIKQNALQEELEKTIWFAF